jgi:hypothetical protein
MINRNAWRTVQPSSTESNTDADYDKNLEILKVSGLLNAFSPPLISSPFGQPNVKNNIKYSLIKISFNNNLVPLH